MEKAVQVYQDPRNYGIIVYVRHTGFVSPTILTLLGCKQFENGGYGDCEGVLGGLSKSTEPPQSPC